MDNPEEILQALDQFQKVRPSEIPRELEEYLCWVAKTGEPIYQWNLIKVLFREKLTRVMTEFYESCPSLDLTPCPNVEQFNYDVMKKTLLDRLENFVSAPFTVQRICELLTSPRKEYNRIDKFMRAIEKNILVVSTKEPSSFGRRSENGDGMVNGSIETESPNGLANNEVEMDSWDKECINTATPSGLVSQESEGSSLENGYNSTVKCLATDSEFKVDNPILLQDKVEPRFSSVTVDTMTHNFVNTSPDFDNIVMTTSVSQDLPIVNPSIHSHQETDNLSSITKTSDSIVNEEDTNSQPSLDLGSSDDSSDSSSTENTNKLHNIFQVKDFNVEEETDTALEPEQKAPVAIESESNETSQAVQSLYSNEKSNVEDSYNIEVSDKSNDDSVIINENGQVDTKNDDNLDSVNSNDSLNFIQEEKYDNVPINADNIQISTLNTDCNPCDFISSQDNIATEVLTKETENIEVNNAAVDTTVPQELLNEPLINEPIKLENISQVQIESIVTEEKMSNVEKPVAEKDPVIVEKVQSTLKEAACLVKYDVTIEKATAEDDLKSKILDVNPVIVDSEDVQKDEEDKSLPEEHQWNSSQSVIEITGDATNISDKVKDNSAEENKEICNMVVQTNEKEESINDFQESKDMITDGEELAEITKNISDSMDVDSEAAAMITDLPQDEPMEQESASEIMSS